MGSAAGTRPAGAVFLVSFWLTERGRGVTEHVYIFLHNPKTGGTTFNGHCVKHLEQHVEFVHFGPFGRKAAEGEGLPPFAKRDPALRGRARVLGGHGTWYGLHELVPGKAPRYFTFLRRPAARLVSKCNGFMSRRKNVGRFRTFDEWYAEEPRNGMTELYNRFAGLELASPDLDAAREFLDRLWYVGVTERLDEALAFLFREIGVEGPVERLKVSGERKPGDLAAMDREIPKLLQLTPELERRLDDENPLDVALYEHAVRLMERGPRTD